MLWDKVQFIDTGEVGVIFNKRNDGRVEVRLDDGSIRTIDTAYLRPAERAAGDDDTNADGW